jgi:hypothetical protein
MDVERKGTSLAFFGEYRRYLFLPHLHLPTLSHLISSYISICPTKPTLPPLPSSSSLSSLPLSPVRQASLSPYRSQLEPSFLPFLTLSPLLLLQPRKELTSPTLTSELALLSSLVSPSPSLVPRVQPLISRTLSFLCWLLQLTARSSKALTSRTHLTVRLPSPLSFESRRGELPAVVVVRTAELIRKLGRVSFVRV